MRHVCLLIVAVSIAFAQPLPAIDPVVKNLALEIEESTFAEPILFSLDTRLQAAEVLAPRFADLSVHFSLGALSLITGLGDEDSRNHFLAKIAKQLAAVNFDEAERTARRITPRKASETRNDYLGAAFTSLTRAALIAGRDPVEVLQQGFYAGAFRNTETPRILSELLVTDPARAEALFHAIRTIFPKDNATPEDIELLLNSLKVMAHRNRQTTISCIDQLIATINASNFDVYGKQKTSRTFNFGEKKVVFTEVREALLFPVAAFVYQFDKELWNTNRNRYPSWNKLFEKANEKAFLELRESRGFFDFKTDDADEEDLENEPTPSDFERLAFDEAIRTAQALKSINQRAVTLFEISERKSNSPAQRSMAMRLAVTASEKMTSMEVRMLLQGLATGYFATNQEPEMAATSAQMLATSFARQCRCEDASCNTLKGRESCSEHIDDFVEYLSEGGVDESALRIRHPSIRSRALVQKLQRHLKGK